MQFGWNGSAQCEDAHVACYTRIRVIAANLSEKLNEYLQSEAISILLICEIHRYIIQSFMAVTARLPVADGGGGVGIYDKIGLLSMRLFLMHRPWTHYIYLALCHTSCLLATRSISSSTL